MVYSHLARNRTATGLLVIAFLAFIGGAAAVFSMAQTGDPLSFALPTLGFGVFYVLVSFLFSRSAVLALSGAKRIHEQHAPELYHMMENLAISRGVPMPALYLIQDASPNAFATGIGQKNAAVAVTTGLMDTLEKNEVEGVLAHELAHIQHGDTQLMTIVVLLVGVITLVSDFFLRSLYFSGGSRSNSDTRRGGNAIFIIISVVLALLSPFIAQLLKLAISRKREFYADAEAALTTRYPEGLARALEKITSHHAPLRSANHATAHLYICSPFKASDGRSWWHSMFSTHPDPGERIQRLRSMMV